MTLYTCVYFITSMLFHLIHNSSLYSLSLTHDSSKVQVLVQQKNDFRTAMEAFTRYDTRNKRQADMRAALFGDEKYHPNVSLIVTRTHRLRLLKIC